MSIREIQVHDAERVQIRGIPGDLNAKDASAYARTVMERIYPGIPWYKHSTLPMEAPYITVGELTKLVTVNDDGTLKIEWSVVGGKLDRATTVTIDSKKEKVCASRKS